MKFPSLVLGYLLISVFAFAQTPGVAINNSGAPANPAAILDVSSNGKGVLIPRLSSSEVQLMNPLPAPAEGLLIYMTDGTPGFYYNASTTTNPDWRSLSTGAGQNSGGCYSHTALITSDNVFMVPAGVTTVKIMAWGGGGGGAKGTYDLYMIPGGAYQSITTATGGGGGGGGAYVEDLITVQAGESIMVTIGQGGTGETDNSLATDGGGTLVFSSYANIFAGGGLHGTGMMGGSGGIGSGGFLLSTLGSGGSGGYLRDDYSISYNHNILSYPPSSGSNGGGSGYISNGFPGGGGGGGIGGGNGIGGVGSFSNAQMNSGAGGGGGVGSTDPAFHPGGNGAAGKVIILW